MDRRIFSTVILFAVLAALTVGFSACHSDTIAPTIYFYEKDGKTIDKKGDTTVLLYTKYVDPGYLVEDNASIDENIQVSSDMETVLPIEKKIAAHM